MLVFGLCSTFDDWLNNLSDKSHLKCEKWPPNQDEFSIAFKVKYISEDLLPGTVTSRYGTLQDLC